MKDTGRQAADPGYGKVREMRDTGRQTADPGKAREAQAVAQDPWSELRRHTDARIALGRCGVSLPVARWLEFRLAHAQARDAVRTFFDREYLIDRLKARGIACLNLASAADDLETFLARPDLGRRLSAASAAALEEYARTHGAEGGVGANVCLVVSNGLSARSIHDNAAPFIDELLPLLDRAGLSVSPAVLVQNGRVAVADEVAYGLRAELSVILVGERPGLSSPNSMGVYMTYAPKPGCTDEARNCISNVRPGGLEYAAAARKLCYLVQSAFACRYSGVRLKDDMPDTGLPSGLSTSGMNRIPGFRVSPACCKN
ncbi:MAG: ethanolamine ammonia-lyase subunit EutC [Desulfovibrio sp.]|jgi:ethanolamine ammonia-lyase small subunit|nr:ethanolamine ammonia-lyase subunit EutC [Desulfovibrio sp.]